MTTTRAQALTPEAFDPFGRVVDQPTRAQDADGPGWNWWAEIETLESDGRSWTFGYLDLLPTEFSFDWAERHLRSHEVVLAGSADILVYVGEAVPGEPDKLPALEDFHVFRVLAGRGVVLKPGVWHGAPLSLSGHTSALVLLLEGTGRSDVEVVRFTDTPVAIEVGS